MDPLIKEEKRRRILLAAEELLAARSSHEVKLDEVAERAGIGKGTIYLYFRDKENLFFEVTMSGFEELCALIRGAVSPTGGDFDRQLLRVCHAISLFFRAAPCFAEHDAGRAAWLRKPPGRDARAMV